MQKEHFFLGNQIAEPRSFTPRAKVVPPLLFLKGTDKNMLHLSRKAIMQSLNMPSRLFLKGKSVVYRLRMVCI